MQLHEIIRRPLVTEKNATLQIAGKYAFEVDRRANKMQIKKAVQDGFKVTVTSVNVVTMPGETKRVGNVHDNQAGVSVIQPDVIHQHE